MKKLSKEAEDRLLGAIEKTAKLVNDGSHPNEAIVKAAQEDGIPPGQINLMVHAYNTGRTTRQRQEGDSPLERAAEFPLADAKTVLDRMYPDQVKTAGEITRDTTVSLEYAVPPTGLLERRARRELLKEGQSIDWRRWARGDEEVVAEDPGPLPGDPAERMKKAYCNAERLQREVNEARREVAVAMDKMATTFHDVTEYFRQPGSTPIPVVKEQAFLLHGDKGRQLIDEVVKVTPGLSKFARHQVKVSNYLLGPADGEIYGLISQFMDELDHYKKCKQAHADLLAKHAETAEALIRPFVERPRSVLDELGYSTEKEKTALGVMPALIGASAIKNLLAGGGPEAGQAETEAALADLTDPAHEQELRNIRAQAMLQDMMMNDPVIAGYDPEEALDAYNDIVQVTPRAADQRVVMQPLLRKRLEQGALDPFEVDQMLGLEEKQKKINTPVGTGGGDGSVLS
jgi:hypothetical protein